MERSDVRSLYLLGAFLFCAYALPFAIVVKADVVPTTHVMKHVIDGKEIGRASCRERV